MASPNEAPARLAYSVSEVAARLGRDRRSVQRLLDAGAFGPKNKLPRGGTGKHPRSPYLIPASCIDAFLYGEKRAS